MKSSGTGTPKEKLQNSFFFCDPHSSGLLVRLKASPKGGRRLGLQASAAFQVKKSVTIASSTGFRV